MPKYHILRNDGTEFELEADRMELDEDTVHLNFYDADGQMVARLINASAHKLPTGSNS